MLQQLKQTYHDTKQVHSKLYQELKQIEQLFATQNLAGKIDTVYALQKVSDTLTDIRKQVDKVVKSMTKPISIQMEFEQLASISTPYCTAKTKVEMFANVPHKREKDPEKFDRLMQGLGVPLQVSQQEGVRFHWPGFKDLLTLQQEQGLPLPEGLSMDDVYTEYTLQCRKKLEPDEV